MGMVESDVDWMVTMIRMEETKMNKVVKMLSNDESKAEGMVIIKRMEGGCQ